MMGKAARWTLDDPHSTSIASLQFPVTPAAAGAVTLPAEPPAGVPPLDILMIDDDELLRASVPTMLRILGHRVETADAGLAGLAWLDAGGKADLVILDMNMPGMGGLETLRRIRSRAEGLPVLLATGYLDAEVHGIVAGDPQVRVLGKPFTLVEIQKKLLELHKVAGG